jgi:hypothetical protein
VVLDLMRVQLQDLLVKRNLEELHLQALRRAEVRHVVCACCFEWCARLQPSGWTVTEVCTVDDDDDDDDDDDRRTPDEQRSRRRLHLCLMHVFVLSMQLLTWRSMHTSVPLCCTL